MVKEKYIEIEMRKKIVAGNWKMNLFIKDAFELSTEIIKTTADITEVELIIFPPSLFTVELAKLKSHLKLGVQNFYPAESGAFTGEISVTQIKDAGATYSLIGHSERRAIFGENAELLRAKVDAALKHTIKFIFCCGEPLDIRENGNELSFVKQQLIDSLFHLTSEQILSVIIAYEPVWAIGTGKTASVNQAEEMHAAIRSWIAEKYDLSIANKISILYGGSCNASNAKELFACPNVDGGLIGGAALQAESFNTIARSF
jgi:triosephosphate isomerase